MSTETKVKVPLSQIIFDFNIYPRHKVSEYHVNELVEALKGGASFPPIVLDKKTNRIIDGGHRVNAYKKTYDLEYKAEAILLDCKNEGEVILKAIEYNCRHGLNLSAWDKSRCLWLAEKNNIEKTLIEKAICASPERLEQLRNRIVPVHNSSGKTIRETQLKHGQNKLAEKEDGRYVTEKEADIIEGNTSTGLSSGIRLNTLIRDLSSGIFDISEKNIAKVREMYELLGEVITKYEEEHS